MRISSNGGSSAMGSEAVIGVRGEQARPQRSTSSAFDGVPCTSAASNGCATRQSSGGGASRKPRLTQTSGITRSFKAATTIQTFWRMYRIRRAYVRLINRVKAEAPHLLMSAQASAKFPPIPPEPLVSRFSMCCRPHAFHERVRRVWPPLERALRRATPPARSSAAAGPSTSSAAATAASATAAAEMTPAAAAAVVPGPAPTAAAAAVAAPPALAACSLQGTAPRSPLRVRIPHTQPDVAMSEVERIIDGGFWRDEPAAAPPSEGLSMFMQQKMRQEEREAEEALEMLAYDPRGSDLAHHLGALQALTRSIVSTAGSTLTHTMDTIGSSLSRSLARGGGGLSSMGMPTWRATASGSGSSAQERARGRPPRHHQASSSLPRGGGGGGPLAATTHSGELRVPLLHIVDADSHTTVLPQQPIPIAINPARLRSRSTVARMSL